MVNNVRMAINLGYLDVVARRPADHVGDEQPAARGGRHRLHRQPGRADRRAGAPGRRRAPAVADHAGDTVVLSATPIPGNEEMVNQIIDDLFRLGANVIYSDLSDVHVSGHGSREDLKLMLSLVRPRSSCRCTANTATWSCTRALAREVGIPAENMVIVESGQVVEVTPTRSAGRGGQRRARPGGRPERGRHRLGGAARPDSTWRATASWLPSWRSTRRPARS